MIQKWLLRILLSPLSLLYGIGVSLHSLAYQSGLLKPVRFDLPVISVGNLSVGGTGKTPHIEYLIRLLKDYLEIAVLSRGYMRKTRGFRYAYTNSNASDVGDEPLQFKLKYPDITVAVSESRSLAIPQMVMQQPGIQTILLDDAFQHRSVNPALQILLTEHDRLFTRDYLLPAGRLREWRQGYVRADHIIVTKCPATLTMDAADKIKEEIAPYPHQKVWFSAFQYGMPYALFNPSQRIAIHQNTAILLVAAIANTDYLMDYLHSNAGYVDGMPFEDHHFFSGNDMSQIHFRYNNLPEAQQRVILTTEKDATRLALHAPWIREQQLPVYILPVQVYFLFEAGSTFNENIRQFLLDFKS